jgi:membrane-associated protease RseP (regulator of RpoE activity)
MDTPGLDVESVTGMVGGGAQVVVFTTGLGTPTGNPIAPVIKITASSLPAVKLGDPAKLRVGEAVAAIGSPFGFENSVTAGIVSAKGRSLPSESYVPYIQTDVPINPGNSGGPLFNMKGEVVGINSQIYSRSGGYQGVSFAIPIDVAMEVADQLKRGGKVSRGWLGVVIQEVTADLAESFGLDRPRGALIAQVQVDGPAARAGLQAADVILTFDGKLVEDSGDLPRMVDRVHDPRMCATRQNNQALVSHVDGNGLIFFHLKIEHADAGKIRAVFKGVVESALRPDGAGG